MGVSLVLTIRTADRRPKRNYLGKTVRTLLTQGVDPHALHLFPTDPEIAWIDRELAGLPPLHIHVPEHRCTPNENGIRQVSALEWSDAEWILMLEDDVEVCADFLVSVALWLTDHVDQAWHVYRLHALPSTKFKRYATFASTAPLQEMKGSQAVLLRRADAEQFAAWATAHPKNWRPKEAPFQQYPDRGFDKLIGYWALHQWPEQPNGLVAIPMLVNHIGRESALHSHGVRNDQAFAGVQWRYPGLSMESSCPS